MIRTLVALAVGILLVMAIRTASGESPLAVERLRCEYLANPLGIDVVKPRLSWILSSGPRGRQQGAYQVLVGSAPETLQRDRGDLWDSGRVRGEQSTFVVYEGRPLTSGARCYWKVRVWDREGHASPWSAPAHWSMGLLRDADWTARWIGEARPEGVKEGTPLPFPWLRKTFALKERPRRATAYVNALGYYELYVNGKKVDDQVLAPAVSDYARRNFYVTHDVTDYLLPGKNCVALWLGRGWYVRGHPGVIHDGPLVRAQLDLELPDGASLRVGTDASWKLRESPISPLGRGTAFGDYGGEHYDARLELPGWNSARLDDSRWEAAALFDPPKVVTAAQMVEPNRIVETSRPMRVQETAPGVYLFELPQNLTGWFELRLPRGTAAGKTVKLDYTDTAPDGDRFRNYNQRDEYVSSGAAEQTFRSRFNYHGFGWVRVTGLERAPTVADATASLITTSYAPAAEFTSSSDLLNRIWRMATRTYRCLTLGGYVVDCPTRERLGYGGDAGTSIEVGTFNFDTGALYNRWSANWRDAQDAAGDLPYTAPAYPNQGGGGPMWSGFVVTMPWQLYLQYGDRRILETSYPTIRKWLAFLESKTRDHVLEPYQSYGMAMPQWNFLGDWVAPTPAGGGRDQFGNRDSVKFINNCHYLYQLQLAAKIASVLGKSEDAAAYQGTASALSRALHQRFYQAATHSYATGEQPYLAFPLLVGIVPPELRQGVMENLVETIETKNRGHIDAGMHGTYFLLKYLMEADRNDLIHAMATKTDFPSWGNMVDTGHGTAWESWRGGGTRIHDTLISVGSWFIQGIGGIRIDEKSPGFRHFLVRPAPVGELSSARVLYRSPYGPIVSDWRIVDGSLRLQVTVPAGTTATIFLPTAAPASVTEGGRPAAQASGARAAGAEGGRAAFQVVSGEYDFRCRLGR